ncbi:MAG: sensor histidine kinase [Sporolactobacillus sp.]
MNNYEIVEKAGFRFSPRFGQLIGRNLISNSIVAVSELVKNSYDADADNISIEFENLNDEKNSKLIVLDDGDGMSLNDIVNKWLVVGTDNKIVSKYSKKKRRKLGEKGIGRFSVERLAHRIKIITRQEEQSYALQLSIDWEDYEKMLGEFSDKKYNILKEEYPSIRKGTCLILEGLRDNWNKESLSELRKELNLIRPININEMSYKKYSFPGENVKILLTAKELGVDHKMLDLGFIGYYQAHLFGEIKNDGNSTIRVEIKPSLSLSNESVDELFKYEADSSEIDISCGPVTFEVFVFFKDRRLYRSLDITKSNFDALLESYSGVKIYRDGFRILPFGDPGNDWLELNAKRTHSPEHRIGTVNAIGIVYITRDKNPGLQDVLSRENMYDTAEFKSLKSFVNKAFEQYTDIQLKARKKKDKEKQEKGKIALVDAQKSVKNFTKQIGSLQKKVSYFNETTNPAEKEATIVSISTQLNKLLDTATTSLSTVKTAYSYYRLQDNFKTREMQIYRNIATLGISAAMFGHESLNKTTHAKVICQTIIKRYDKGLLELNNNFHEMLTNLFSDINLIDEKADFFRSYLRKEKHDRARSLNLTTLLIKILNQHQKAFSSINVAPILHCSLDEREVTTWGYEGDFNTIFTNLVTNAYKALKTEEKNKHLIFIVKRESENIIICSENNGKPIKEENRSKIFEPLYSAYSDGTGLGLTIVQDTLISYKGKIKLCDQYPETKFEITIPLQRGPGEE